MAGPVKILIAASLLALACSHGPSAPEAERWSGDDLIGDWSGQLPLLSMVPEASIPFWPDYRNNPLYGRRYDFRNLDVNVHISESEFLILLQYRSDSLYFLYEERGGWKLSGQAPRQLVMDSTRLSGRLETWNSAVNWDTSGCCWQADMDVRDVDPASAGFGARVLRIYEIRSRLAIGDLQLDRDVPFPAP